MSKAFGSEDAGGDFVDGLMVLDPTRIAGSEDEWLEDRRNSRLHDDVMQEADEWFREQDLLNRFQDEQYFEVLSQ